MKFNINTILMVVVSATMFSGCAILGKSGKESASPTPQVQNGQRPAGPAGRGSAPAEIKKFGDVIKSAAEKDEGLFNVYKQEQKYYYEIPNDMLGREMLMVSRISKTADLIGYGGEVLNNQTLRWERREKQVLLRVVSFNNVAADSLPIAQAVRNSNFEPIIMSFNIEAYNDDTTGVVIDVTGLFSTDVPAFGLQDSRRRQYQVRRLDANRSFIETIKSYPTNIETRKVLTYEAGSRPQTHQPVRFH